MNDGPPTGATPAATVPGVAMILAAGRGYRLGQLTEALPKPLMPIGDGALIDLVLARLKAAGVERVVVNLHHEADLLAAHLARYSPLPFDVSREAALLDTGGGVRRALPELGAAPFYAINADAVWLDGYQPALARMAALWNAATMDALLLLFETTRCRNYGGMGDFMCDPAGVLRRRGEHEVAPFIYTGLQILHPRLFDGSPEGAFSLNRLYDRASASGRLHGLVHDGEWLDAGTPENLRAARRMIEQVGRVMDC
ncbi:MAG: nucleotidyltransferase family protein [Alphaproteobacteria bacterium]|nr:nucleotidyltransferase family protein [Alphaproteobacteria bacterium]